ncbi:hypothetical protein J1D01_16360 [Seonamhaeicola sp. NFXS20]
MSISLFSCKKKTTLSLENKDTISFSNDSFSIVSKLKSEVLKRVSDSILVSYRIKIDEEYMYLNEIKSNKYLNIVKLPEEDFIGTFGTKGKGPCETIVAWSISKSDNETLLILDPKQKKIVEYNVDSLINNKPCIKEYKVADSVNCRNAFIYENKVYYTDQNNTEFRFFESNFEGGNVKGHGSLETNISFNDFRKNSGKINNAHMVHNDDLFVFGYHYFPLIELFDLENNKWKSIVGPTNEIPDEEFKGRDFVYNSIRVTKKFIYALYASRMGEIDVDVIFVFNLNGQPEKKLILDRGIFTFDVYNDKYIYGLNYEENKILKFEI